MKSISTRLSVFVAAIVSLLLVGAGATLIVREVQVAEHERLREAQTVASTGAAAYGRILDDAIEAGHLTLDEVLSPRLEEIPFTVPVESKRYRSKLSDYTDSHGIQQIEDAIIGSCDDCLFASGMMPVRIGSDTGCYVPTTNSRQDLPPSGDFARDRLASRGKRIYDDAVHIAAAAFAGGTHATVLIQEYPRDTGQSAWDVAAPIFVHGQHWGGFRVGVSRDQITAQRSDTIVRLIALFGFLAILAAAAVLWASRRMIKPLVDLTADVDRMSTTSSTRELGTKIECADKGEIGRMAVSVNRLRVSLHGAMNILDVRHDMGAYRSLS